MFLAGCGSAGLDTRSPVGSDHSTNGAGSGHSTAGAAPSTSAAQQPPGPQVSQLQGAVQSALQQQVSGPDEGGDVSWPQCPRGMGIPQKQGKGAPMPLPSARFVLLGLTNGPGLTANPCLADQVAWAKAHHLMMAAYSVISAQGSGAEQARFNLETMKTVGLDSPSVWVDVEPVPDFDWPNDTAANATVIRDAVRTYQRAGLEVGVYSTQSLWQRVVGDLRLGLPEWRAAGQTSRAEALARCGEDRSFQGGGAVLTQWVEAGRDRDVPCPGRAGELALWLRPT